MFGKAINCTIKNMTLKDFSISTNVFSVGLLVGLITTSNISNIHITASEPSGNNNITIFGPKEAIGGLVVFFFC